MQSAAVALNRNRDPWKLLNLPADEFAIEQAIVAEAQRLHIQEVEAIADRTANQVANRLGPMLNQVIRQLARSMRG